MLYSRNRVQGLKITARLFKVNALFKKDLPPKC